MDYWSELESIIFKNARSSSVCFFFLFQSSLNLLLNHNDNLMLVEPFLLVKMFALFCFTCLTSSVKVIHSFVVCSHLPWYWQKFFPICSSSESSSSESKKFTYSLFLTLSWIFFCFLRKNLGGLIFLNFQSLSRRILLQNGYDHLNNCIHVSPFPFTMYLAQHGIELL